MKIYLEGSRWFRRLQKDCLKISSHIRFVRVKLGFYRVYWDDAYIHEVYKEMPEFGYDIDDLDPRFENQKYWEEYEDNADLTRKIKNYVEGYYDSLDRIKTRVYLLKNDAEFNKSSRGAYKQMYIR